MERGVVLWCSTLSQVYLEARYEDYFIECFMFMIIGRVHPSLFPRAQVRCPKITKCIMDLLVLPSN